MVSAKKSLAGYAFIAPWMIGFTLVAVPLGVILGVMLGVILALLLNLELRGMGIYETIFFLSSILPIVVLFFFTQKTFVSGIATTGSNN